MIGALKSGQVDAMIMVPHIAKPLQRGGAGKIIGWLRDYAPDYQISVLINGMAHGVQAQGMTQLAGSASQSQAPIAVDSLEGFRPFGCIRIGQELIEYTIENGVMTALRQETGRFAGQIPKRGIDGGDT